MALPGSQAFPACPGPQLPQPCPICWCGWWKHWEAPGLLGAHNRTPSLYRWAGWSGSSSLSQTSLPEPLHYHFPHPHFCWPSLGCPGPGAAPLGPLLILLLLRPCISCLLCSHWTLHSLPQSCPRSQPLLPGPPGSAWSGSSWEPPAWRQRDERGLSCSASPREGKTVRAKRDALMQLTDKSVHCDVLSMIRAIRYTCDDIF